jgi:hypothetical protein
MDTNPERTTNDASQYGVNQTLTMDEMKRWLNQRKRPLITVCSR